MTTSTTRPDWHTEFEAYQSWVRAQSPEVQRNESRRRLTVTTYCVQLLEEDEEGIECLGEFDTRREAEKFMDAVKWSDIPEPGYILELEKMVQEFRGGIADAKEPLADIHQGNDYAQLRRRYRS